MATTTTHHHRSTTTPSSQSKYGYPLNFDWKHPWPRAPTPSNEDARLAELARYRILESEPDEKFDKLCRIACKEMKCPIAAVSFIDKQKQWFKANSGLTQRQIPRDVALCAHTIMHAKRALVVEDTSLDERFQHNPLVTRASAVRFYAGVPITTPSGFCIGSVFVFDVKGHHNVDAKILHKIAAKVLKYMDERLKLLKGATTSDDDNLNNNNNVTTLASSTSLPSFPLPSSSSLSLSRTDGPSSVKRKLVSPPLSQKHSTEQPAGETAMREQQPLSPTLVKPEPAAEPVPDVETTSSAIVQAAQATAAASSTAIEAQTQGQGGLGNMGSMLMNLLARTTETQQQLAAQQGVMFETLGEHSNQLDQLGQSMSNLEKRFEQVRLKKEQQRNVATGTRRSKRV
uniref:GAF domain-containing protein n=1 Tax=Hyaloperonospora arabidopsidis (strain Emoy2) TaxID=559515 RepID=M4BTS2_HYAAE